MSYPPKDNSQEKNYQINSTKKDVVPALRTPISGRKAMPKTSTWVAKKRRYNKPKPDKVLIDPQPPKPPTVPRQITAPTVLGEMIFQTQLAKYIIDTWTKEYRWKIFFQDLETLEERIKGGEIGEDEGAFINFLTSYDGETRGTFQPENISEKRLISKDQKLIKRWIETYPYLAYINIIEGGLEEQHMRYYALMT